MPHIGNAHRTSRNCMQNLLRWGSLHPSYPLLPARLYSCERLRMFGPLSRRHLLALSSGAALSALASACSPVVSRPQPLTKSSPDHAAPAPQSTQTKAATTTRSITQAEPLPASALDGRGPALLPDHFFERSGNFSNGTLSHRAVNVPRPIMPRKLKSAPLRACMLSCSTGVRRRTICSSPATPTPS